MAVVAIMQILELPSVASPQEGVAPSEPITHPYFIGAQFHPELTSRPVTPQPMFMGLVAASLRHRFEHNESQWDQILKASPVLKRWLRSPNGHPQSTS